jgi:hypothetical protein
MNVGLVGVVPLVTSLTYWSVFCTCKLVETGYVVINQSENPQKKPREVFSSQSV